MATQLKDLIVFIGRFSPLHNGHLAVIERALKTSKAVLVLVGSSGQARTTKNPFTFEERREMIYRSTLSIDHDAALRIKPLYDHPYNDQAWIRGVQDAVDEAKNELVDFIGINPQVYLTGADRDHSTWYLNSFGDLFNLDLITDGTNLSLSATQVRDVLFGNPDRPELIYELEVPPATTRLLFSFMQTEDAAVLIKEYDFIKKYKDAWSAAPYAPTFMTVDACVIQSGHVLVNVRDNFPGVGLWALPGGFLEQNEKLVDGCIRELVEETRIGLSKAQLYGSIRSKEIFDHPDRSLRGRTITTCFLMKLDDTKPLPKVKPQKGEVRKVMWIPINEALKRTDLWFEDHASIVRTMIGRVTN